MTKLFLIPTTLANPINGHVLTNEQVTLINHLNIFIVETAKIGRQHLKQLNLSNSLQSLTIMELNRGTHIIFLCPKKKLDKYKRRI